MGLPLIAIDRSLVVSAMTVDLNVYLSDALDADTWTVSAYNAQDAISNATLTAQVHCLRAEPAGLRTAAKNSHYGPKKTKVRLPGK